MDTPIPAVGAPPERLLLGPQGGVGVGIQVRVRVSECADGHFRVYFQAQPVLFVLLLSVTAAGNLPGPEVCGP